jgi:sec-independent protein translocase protein TatA
MFNGIGPMELVIVLVIALIVLGPKRLPEVGRSLGRGMREFKESVTGTGRDDQDDLDDDDVAHTLPANPANTPK